MGFAGGLSADSAASVTVDPFAKRELVRSGARMATLPGAYAAQQQVGRCVATTDCARPGGEPELFKRVG